MSVGHGNVFVSIAQHSERKMTVDLHNYVATVENFPDPSSDYKVLAPDPDILLPTTWRVLFE